MSVTYSALTTCQNEARAQSLSQDIESLEPLGVGVFEIEDGSGLWEVAAYFEEGPDEIALALLAAAHQANPFVISEIPEQDWVAKVRRELVPVEAGRFFLYGSHDADKVPEDRVALLIEATMAFGTGHHGTTLGCLRALDRMLERGEEKTRIADIGCGTAVLAMAAAIGFDQPVVASDIDPVAIDVAEANFEANGLAGRVATVVAPGFDDPRLKAQAPYDLIFANILMGPLIALAPDMAAMTAQGGHVILSGILNEQADTVQGEYERQGFALFEKEEIGEWTTLVMQRT